MAKNIFLGIAWPYVNGDIHAGHLAGYLFPSDIVARYHRLRGNNVLMVSGSDCFGTPITVEAEARGVSPEVLVAEYHPKAHTLMRNIGMSFDLYTATTSDTHKTIVQSFFRSAYEKGFIRKGSSVQYFSLEENRFLPDRYVEGTCAQCGTSGARSDQCDACGAVLSKEELNDPVSKNTGTPVELRETSHYYFRYNLCEKFLKNYVAEYGQTWKKWVRAETEKWLKMGIREREITRDLTWGVPLPVDDIKEEDRLEQIDKKRLYVWFDAVIGYFSASVEWASKEPGRSWEQFWRDSDALHYYFMGKDNLVFHTLFWPAYLHVHDESLTLPKVQVINHFLMLEGQKFSKSRGITLDPMDLISTHGLDNTRFYFTTILPETADTNFVQSEFAASVNALLVGKIGNFINRSLTLSKGIDFEEAQVDTQVATTINETSLALERWMEQGRVRKYIEHVLECADYANSYITEAAPWKLKKEGDKEYDYQAFLNVMASCQCLTIFLGFAMKPITFVAIEKLEEQLGFELKKWPEDVAVYALIKIKNYPIQKKAQPLFSKIE